MAEKLFSVIIISWRVRDLVDRCLNSLSKVGTDVQVIVVDNNSADGTVELVRNKYPAVELLALPSNVGFAAANNLASRQARGQYLVLLNPDTIVPEDFFKKVREFWLSHPQAGAVGGQILNEDGSIQPSVRRLPKLGSQLVVLLKVSRWAKFFLKDYLALDFDYRKSQVVEQVMGACLICPQIVWRQLSGFDENFFVWFEEVDFCYRLSLAGYKIWYEPSIKIKHRHRASFSQLSYVERHRLFKRSLVYYADKHWSLASRLLIRLAGGVGLIFAYVGQLFFPNKI